MSAPFFVHFPLLLHILLHDVPINVKNKKRQPIRRQPIRRPPRTIFDLVPFTGVYKVAFPPSLEGNRIKLGRREGGRREGKREEGKGKRRGKKGKRMEGDGNPRPGGEEGKGK